MRIAIERTGRKAIVEAEKKEQQYKEETTIALEDKIKKGVELTALVDCLPSLVFSQLIYVLGRRRHRYGRALMDYIDYRVFSVKEFHFDQRSFVHFWCG